ncbi:MAG: tetratricopeptide repeat protein [Acidobacteriota bacterium]
MIRRTFLSGATPIVLFLAVSLVLSPSAPRAVQKKESEVQLAFGAKVARMGSWREAAFRFEKAAQADPSNARAFNNLAVARESLGQFKLALAAYKAALALDPDNKRIRMNYEKFMDFYRDQQGVNRSDR